jgi:hypothetical protein
MDKLPSKENTTIFKLLASEDEALLIRWDIILILNLHLHIVDGVREFDFEHGRLASQLLHEDLHPTTESEDEMEGRLLLNIVIGEHPAIFQPLSCEDEVLLARRVAMQEQ